MILLPQPTKPMFRRRVRGSALVQVLICTALFAILSLMIGNTFVAAGRVSQRVYERAGAQQSARGQIAGLLADIQAADAVLASPAGVPIPSVCGTGGTSACGSNSNDTLVLRLPSLTTAGDTISGRSDYVVYRLASATGTDAPGVLYRTCYPSLLGSSRVSRTNQIVARKVGRIPDPANPTIRANDLPAFAYLAQSSWTGDGTRTSWTLPASVATGGSSGSSTGLTAQVLVNGVDQLPTGSTHRASLSGTTMTCQTAPPNGASVDVTYPVSPSTSTGLNGTTHAAVVGVHLAFWPSNAVPGAGNGGYYPLYSVGILRNRTQ